ncbi:hypothetical protein SCLCIDRAFT_1191548, partial [Scleroderma citrinum Foug A]
RKWQYKLKTRNGALCTHILNFHLSLYLDEAEKNGWIILLNYVREAVTDGYTITTIQEALQRPGVTIKNLPQLQNCPVAYTSPEVGLPPFTISTMHQYLIRFIVADDQSISVVECPEFWHLLLLRYNLCDLDIPHRTKTRELIIEAW